MTSRGILTSTGLILAVILVVALNVLASNTLNSARLDLTENKLFTLSEGSLKVLRSIEEPLTLRFYFSKSLASGAPQIMRYGERVRDLLQQYATVADGMIRLEIIDPEPFTEAEDDAVRNGLQAYPVTLNDNLYFGLVGTNAVDDREVIKFFNEDKENFLEYELTRLVYNLSEPAKPKVGLITSHMMNADVSPLMTVGGQGPQQWAIVPQIRETFELEQIYASAEAIPEDVDILLIAHPGALSTKLRYAIDQFVLGGGRAIVALDPLSEVATAFRQQPRPGMPQVEDHSELPELLKAWGVEIPSGKFVGDLRLARQVNVGIPGKLKAMRYLSWLALGPDDYNLDDVIMSDLGPLNLASAGAVVQTEGATTRFEPLATSSTESMLFEADLLRFGPNPENLLKNFEPDEQSYVLAARVSGPARTAFPDGPPKDETKEEGSATPAGQGNGETTSVDEDAETSQSGETSATAEAAPAEDTEPEPAKPHLTESTRDINVIVVADSDFLYDQFWISQQNFLGQNLFVATAANGDMIANALDNLAGSDDLISLRSRGKSERRFEVMSELRREAEKAYREREEALIQKLEETQQRLNELQGSATAGGGALLSAAQEEEIEAARREILTTRKALRDVQHNLNKDIDRLEAQIKFANIGLIPLVIGVAAVILALLRYRRRRIRADMPEG